jgi:hypothetical protein
MLEHENAMIILTKDKFFIALSSDQVLTPHKVFDHIYAWFGLQRKQMFDPCLYRQNWSRATHFEPLTNSWGDGLVYFNHAWSKSRVFLSKVHREFSGGASIICMVTA